MTYITHLIAFALGILLTFLFGYDKLDSCIQLNAAYTTTIEAYEANLGSQFHIVQASRELLDSANRHIVDLESEVKTLRVQLASHQDWSQVATEVRELKAWALEQRIEEQKVRAKLQAKAPKAVPITVPVPNLFGMSPREIHNHLQQGKQWLANNTNGSKAN